MATPFFDIGTLTNTLVGLLGPLISLVITIQIFKLVIQLVSGLATEVKF